MLNLNRILVPTDFSELATHAMTYAEGLCDTYRAELHVLHVVTPASDVPMPLAGVGGEVAAGLTLLTSVDELVERKRSALAEFVAKHTRGLAVPPLAGVTTGVPWQEISRYADEARIDLIVIGTHARGVMPRIFLGSTSKAVLEHTACPVLMVPIAAMEKARAAAATTAGPDPA